MPSLNIVSADRGGRRVIFMDSSQSKGINKQKFKGQIKAEGYKCFLPENFPKKT